MYLRILLASFLRRWKRKLLAVSSITLGVALIAAFMTLALDVRDRVARELASFGANIEVRPRAASVVQSVTGTERVADPSTLLAESDLEHVSTFFWSRNVVGYAPFLSAHVRIADGRDATLIGTWFRRPAPVAGGPDTVGVLALSPWWRVGGRWPNESADARECAVGRRLASTSGLQAGDSVTAEGAGGSMTLHVTGIATTGEAADDALLAPLAVAQALAHAPGRYDRLQVSAVTTPETEAARRDPATLSAYDLEILECTGFVTTIARSLGRSMANADAHPVREVSDTQGVVLDRMRGVLIALAVAAGTAAALGVLGAMAAAVLERRTEVGLLKTLGASPFAILSLFVGEAGLLGLSGGLLGYAAGVAGALVVGRAALGGAIHVSPVVLPLCLAIAFLVSVGGSVLPIRRAMQVDPVRVLHGT